MSKRTFLQALIIAGGIIFSSFQASALCTQSSSGGMSCTCDNELPICENGQIPQFNNGQWECSQGLGEVNSQSSMVIGWPDAIICGNSTYNTMIYHAGFMPANGLYYYEHSYTGTWSRVIFNSDGSYYSANGTGSQSPDTCKKNMSEIEADGRAFYFIGKNIQNSVSNTKERFAVFRYENGNVNILKKSGVSSITRTTTGKYYIHWDPPFSDTHYIITGTCNAWGYSGAHFVLEGNNIQGHQLENIFTNKAHIGCRQHDNQLTDSDLIHVRAFEFENN